MGWGDGFVVHTNQQIEPKQVWVSFGDPKRIFGLICKWAMPFTKLRRLKVAWAENHTKVILSENAIKTKFKIIQNRIVSKSIHVTTTARLVLMRKLC